MYSEMYPVDVVARWPRLCRTLWVHQMSLACTSGQGPEGVHRALEKMLEKEDLEWPQHYVTHLITGRCTGHIRAAVSLRHAFRRGMQQGSKDYVAWRQHLDAVWEEATRAEMVYVRMRERILLSKPGEILARYPRVCHLLAVGNRKLRGENGAGYEVALEHMRTLADPSRASFRVAWHMLRSFMGDRHKLLQEDRRYFQEVLRENNHLVN